MTRLRTQMTWLLGIALSMTLAGACTGSKEDNAGSGDKAAEAKDGAKGSAKGKGKGGRGGPVSVRTEKATIATSPRRITLVAPLVGKSQADVYSKVTGRLSAMTKKEGDTVKANELLFRVDRSDPGESFLTTPVLSPLTGWVGPLDRCQYRRTSVANVSRRDRRGRLGAPWHHLSSDRRMARRHPVHESVDHDR